MPNRKRRKRGEEKSGEQAESFRYYRSCPGIVGPDSSAGHSGAPGWMRSKVACCGTSTRNCVWYCNALVTDSLPAAHPHGECQYLKISSARQNLGALIREARLSGAHCLSPEMTGNQVRFNLDNGLSSQLCDSENSSMKHAEHRVAVKGFRGSESLRFLGTPMSNPESSVLITGASNGH